MRFQSTTARSAAASDSRMTSASGRHFPLDTVFEQLVGRRHTITGTFVDEGDGPVLSSPAA
jgi:hypothetical protein